MRRVCAFLLAASILFGCLCALPAKAAAETAQAVPAGGDFAPGEALVLFDASAATAPAADGLNRSTGGGLFGTEVSVEKIYAFPQGAALNYAAQTGAAQLAIAQVDGKGMDTASLLSYLEGLDFVKVAEPNYAVYPDAVSTSDPFIEEQWGLVSDVGLHPEALWEASSFSQEIVVAVIDTGVDYKHPDLAGRVVENTDLYFDAYANEDGVAMDQNGHGTHVAGIIAAATDNGLGVAGVTGEAPVKILPVKVFAPAGGAYMGDLVAGIHHVIQAKQNHGLNIVAANMSLGGMWHSSQIASYAMIRLGEAGVLSVRSAGNDNLDTDAAGIYPTYFENPYAVSVAALDGSGQFDASYSNHGAHSVHIAAPGTDILSTWPQGKGYYDEQELVLRSDGFASGNTYDVAYTWVRSSPPSASDAVVLSGLDPSEGGYGSSAYCLRFDAVQSAGHYNYWIELPDGMGLLSDGQFLSLQLRMEGVSGAYKASFVQGVAAPSYSLSCEAGEWNPVSAFAQSDGEYRLFISCGQTGQDVPRISIDDVRIYTYTYADYKKSTGTSMAAPHAAGAYALISAALPDATLAERRARLLGSSRYDASLADRVNTQGALDLRRALSDGASLAPVIDSIVQSGGTVTVKGWFWGEDPGFTLGTAGIIPLEKTGSSGACTMTFLPGGTSGIQVLTVQKSMEDGTVRSYRMRYDYSPQGSEGIWILNPACAVPSDAMLHDLFAHAGHIFHFMNTVEGYRVQPYTAEGVPEGAAQSISCTTRATRDDFATFADEAAGILYIYDIDHIHRYDMNQRAWLADTASPYGFDESKDFCTGAVAVYNGELLVIGGQGQSGSGFMWRSPLYGTGAWTSSGLPAGFPAYPARAVACGGRIFVFTEAAGDGYIYQYDGRDGGLTLLDGEGLSGLWRSSLAAHGRQILLLGSYDNEEKEQSIGIFEPVWDDGVYLLGEYGAGLAYSICGTVWDGFLYGLTVDQDFGRYTLQRVELPMPILPGDAGRDGRVALDDAVRSARHIVGSGELTGAALSAADYNWDGKVDVQDVVALCGRLVGKE